MFKNMINNFFQLSESLPSTPEAAVGNCLKCMSVHRNNCQQFYGASLVCVPAHIQIWLYPLWKLTTACSLSHRSSRRQPPPLFIKQIGNAMQMAMFLSHWQKLGVAEGSSGTKWSSDKHILHSFLFEIATLSCEKWLQWEKYTYL